ncbi:ABC transporter permease subunit [Glaciecola petra]|uniref:ABC transporter permease subunit n=1 Tax=Glaciecola petra TaxID=3075602 RepID=A0ABU2ZLG5_9ALTE|nr:ABC transporter permease subunit [Aestuariibacter sp. P117]MDT0593474.1 ABC transporter permease subunit [Aestuariibacter sp. P117]
MKSQSISKNKRRYRIDYFFSRFVTGFGFFVLAIFTTLIVHILLNAAPLFQSPDLSFNSSQSKGKVESAEDSLLAPIVSKYNGRWYAIDVSGCQLRVNGLFQNSLNVTPIKQFAPNCSKRLLNYVSANEIIMLRDNNILEIFTLDNMSNPSLRLNASFKLPSFMGVSSSYLWDIQKRNNSVFIFMPGQNEAAYLWHDTNSVSSPLLFKVGVNEKVLPLIPLAHVIKWQASTATLIPVGEQAIQTINYQRNINQLYASPSGLDLYAILDDNTLVKHTLINQNGQFVFRPVFRRQLALDSASNTKLMSDLSNNLLIILNKQGQLRLLNPVTGDVEYSMQLASEIIDYKHENGELLIQYPSRFSHYNFQNIQGLVNLDMLFAKNDYAAYPAPAYIWQTSAASEYQSPKFSLVPLIIGSLKASILALIVALPLALGAAIYTAYFAKPNVRNAIKPSIEMLEAIPSVIIGFIAAVWLAPFAEQYLISIFAVLVLLPIVVVSIAAIHGYLQSRFSHTLLENWQLPLNALLMLLAVVFIFLLSLLITDWSNINESSEIVQNISDLTLSKTAIVVSLALGVAIAPTIYTLIDDALYEVPEGVKQASFALGATPIQTLNKVVLVVALPSIISAIMLGFGRAFGETMIVLMVTGNTPIADWDLLSGLRTLTSNLAIELQEAQVDSTLYHVLFLTAAILFVFTFCVNTIASMLKRRVYKDE